MNVQYYFRIMNTIFNCISNETDFYNIMNLFSNDEIEPLEFIAKYFSYITFDNKFISIHQFLSFIEYLPLLKVKNFNKTSAYHLIYSKYNEYFIGYKRKMNEERCAILFVNQFHHIGLKNHITLVFKQEKKKKRFFDNEEEMFFSITNDNHSTFDYYEPLSFHKKELYQLVQMENKKLEQKQGKIDFAEIIPEKKYKKLLQFLFQNLNVILPNKRLLSQNNDEIPKIIRCMHLYRKKFKNNIDITILGSFSYLIATNTLIEFSKSYDRKRYISVHPLKYIKIFCNMFNLSRITLNRSIKSILNHMNDDDNLRFTLMEIIKYDELIKK